MKNQMQIFGDFWTEEKLAILKKYLSAYTIALKNQPFNLIYIDAFAGTGYRELRKDEHGTSSLFDEINDEDSQKFLDGSTKISLQIKRPFHEYIFVEKIAKKVTELERLKKDFSDRQIQIVNDDANSFLIDYCEKQNWQNNKAVLFLDPFATQVKWSTLEKVAKTGSIDLWILFPLMAVNRLLANDPGKIYYDKLNDIFGTNDWFERFYHTEQKEDLFGQPIEDIQKKCNPVEIGSFFNTRLAEIFNYVADCPRILYNTKRSPIFQFHFASSVNVALKIAGDILGKM